MFAFWIKPNKSLSFNGVDEQKKYIVICQKQSSLKIDYIVNLINVFS